MAGRRAGWGEPSGADVAGQIRADTGTAPGVAPDALQRSTHHDVSPGGGHPVWEWMAGRS
ncbi:hypothetical protein [Deinococcus sp. AB2017081]|uniref:hypothetical protein n=1 Tax=Deinococcus sp. AB2017081 TaxID=3093660 RepID=UPI002ACC09B9|nr:hypothetical protein [Deinococcus sp. AB2017081]WQE95844.1 hypothetical protein U2P90_02875 [Deinococcus sp. AB2017081]